MRRFTCLLFLVVTTSLKAAPAVITPGLWEITMQTESPVPTPPMTTLLCITKAEAEEMAPPKGKPADDCKVVSGGMAGNVLSYAMKCGKRKARSNAHFIYSGDRYEGTVDIETESGNVRQIYTAKRLGACDGDAEVHP